MFRPQLQIKKLHPAAQVPAYMSELAAGMDIQAFPESPIVYWIRSNIFTALCSEMRVHGIASVHDGMTTSDNERFLRCFWEVTNYDRWKRYAKSGRFCKWFGLDIYVVNWLLYCTLNNRYIFKNRII